MHTGSRLFLLAASLLCGGYFAAQGIDFSRNVEPELFSWSAVLFWLAAGMLVAVPLWAPAIVPARFLRTANFVRWAGVLGCLALLLFFGSSVAHGIARLVSGLGAISSGFLASVLLSLTCTAGVAVLLWPTTRGASGKRA